MRKIFAILAISALTLVATPVMTFAALSPEATTKPAEDPTHEDGGNDGDTSPETGINLSFAYIALAGAGAVSAIAAKKVSEKE